AGCHPEQHEPQRGLAEELGGEEHVQLFSSLNGFVTSLKSDTRTYFPFSTRMTMASLLKMRNAASDGISGSAFLVKSNGAISGRLTGPTAFMASTILAESSVAISDGGSFFRMSTSA